MQPAQDTCTRTAPDLVIFQKNTSSETETEGARQREARRQNCEGTKTQEGEHCIRNNVKAFIKYRKLTGRSCLLKQKGNRYTDGMVEINTETERERLKQSTVREKLKLKHKKENTDRI